VHEAVDECRADDLWVSFLLNRFQPRHQRGDEAVWPNAKNSVFAIAVYRMRNFR